MGVCNEMSRCLSIKFSHYITSLQNIRWVFVSKYYGTNVEKLIIKKKKYDKYNLINFEDNV